MDRGCQDILAAAGSRVARCLMTETGLRLAGERNDNELPPLHVILVVSINDGVHKLDKHVEIRSNGTAQT